MNHVNRIAATRKATKHCDNDSCHFRIDSSVRDPFSSPRVDIVWILFRMSPTTCRDLSKPVQAIDELIQPCRFAIDPTLRILAIELPESLHSDVRRIKIAIDGYNGRFTSACARGGKRRGCLRFTSRYIDIGAPDIDTVAPFRPLRFRRKARCRRRPGHFKFPVALTRLPLSRDSTNESAHSASRP